MKARSYCVKSEICWVVAKTSLLRHIDIANGCWRQAKAEGLQRATWATEKLVS